MSTLSESSYSTSNQNQTAFISLPNLSMGISSLMGRLFGWPTSVKTTKRTLSEEAECGQPESLSEWLKNGADVNEVDAYGYTPLVNASLR
jgi:hypothetical protein